MKKLLAFAVVFSVLTSFASVYADDSSNGCGVGWQVTKRTSLFGTSTRDTTNAFLPNTFSMTSGTSGCAKHSIVKNDEKAVIFAVNNSDSLQVEMARGQGEYLQAFARTLGCPDSMMSRLGNLTQSHYDEIIETSHSSENAGVGIYRAVRTSVSADPVLSLACLPSA